MNTVQDLIDQVRSQLDEDNQASISDTRDILPALNRAQDHAMNILARHYEEPLLDYYSLTLTSGQQEYAIPEDSFEDRIEKVELEVGPSIFQEVTRVSYRDATYLESPLKSPFPSNYVVIGKRIRFVPDVSGNYPARIWYLREAPKFVTPQGRIQSVNEASRYVIVDSVGENLSVQSDNLNSYANIIDGSTGEIKASLQIQSIGANSQIVFKASPTRATVLNKTIQSDLTSLVDIHGNPTSIEPDDYISVLAGSCIPIFPKPVNNFCIQYAVSELTRKLGGAADQERIVLEAFEKSVERSWVGRETTKRIKMRARYWKRPYRRFLFSRDTFES